MSLEFYKLKIMHPPQPILSWMHSMYHSTVYCTHFWIHTQRICFSQFRVKRYRIILLSHVRVYAHNIKIRTLLNQVQVSIEQQSFLYTTTVVLTVTSEMGQSPPRVERETSVLFIGLVSGLLSNRAKNYQLRIKSSE